MFEKFIEDIRRTIREELSKALSCNRDAAESSNSSETSQSTPTSNSGTTIVTNLVVVAVGLQR